MTITQLGEKRILVLSNERPVSWQMFYEQRHWALRKKEADRVHSLVRSAVDPELSPFAGLVDVTIRVYYDKQPTDSDNIPAKLYIDGLKGWWLGEDDPGWVRCVTTTSLVDRKFPRVEIEVEQVAQEWEWECQCCFHRWPSKKSRDKHEAAYAASGADHWG